MSLVTQRMKDHAAVLEATMELIPDIEKAGLCSKRPWLLVTRYFFAATAAVLPIPSI